MRDLICEVISYSASSVDVGKLSVCDDDQIVLKTWKREEMDIKNFSWISV